MKSETHSDYFCRRGVDWESYRDNILYFDMGGNQTGNTLEISTLDCVLIIPRFFFFEAEKSEIQSKCNTPVLE